jgi:hypothetical protein
MRSTSEARLWRDALPLSAAGAPKACEDFAITVLASWTEVWSLMMAETCFLASPRSRSRCFLSALVVLCSRRSASWSSRQANLPEMASSCWFTFWWLSLIISESSMFAAKVRAAVWTEKDGILGERQHNGPRGGICVSGTLQWHRAMLMATIYEWSVALMGGFADGAGSRAGLLFSASMYTHLAHLDTYLAAGHRPEDMG